MSLRAGGRPFWLPEVGQCRHGPGLRDAQTSDPGSASLAGRRSETGSRSRLRGKCARGLVEVDVHRFGPGVSDRGEIVVKLFALALALLFSGAPRNANAE